MTEQQITPIEMLDKTLQWFAMDASEMGIGIQMCSRHEVEMKKAIPLIIDKFPELNTSEYLLYSKMIFEKLAKDKYLTLKTYDHKYSDDRYSITFEGKLFSKLGGYKYELKWKAEKERETQERANLELDELRKKFFDYDDNKWKTKWGFILSVIAVLLTAIGLLLQWKNKT